MVKRPGMWVGARHRLKVGAVAGVLRILPIVWRAGLSAGSTAGGGAWVSGSIIGRRLTIEQGA
ncbi:hypothetical protein SAMN04487858_102176 [Pseudomonas sp. ok602]|nr:hypothetical protein SAMN04487858_102176 [Pseudomonas sp. ok602]